MWKMELSAYWLDFLAGDRRWVTFVELDQSLWQIAGVLMIERPAITETSIIGIPCIVLRNFEVVFDIGELVVPTIKVYEFGEHRVFIGIFVKDGFESFDGFLVLVGLEENLGEDRTCLLVLGGDLEEDFACFLAVIVFSLVEVNQREHFHRFFVLWIEFKALFQHELGCFNIFLIIVGIFAYFIVEISGD
jgi:hypothetical protein